MKEQGKSKRSSEGAEFCTFVGIMGIILSWAFFIIIYYASRINFQRMASALVKGIGKELSKT